MIQEDYVSFEVAKLLKEKGFDTFKPYGWYEELFDKEHPRNFSLGFDSKEHWISCPTHQMAMKWLREVHDIYIVFFHTNKSGWWYNITDMKDSHVFYSSEKTMCSYEDAVEAALKYIFENLI